MNKYVYKPYNSLFPSLFEKEKERIQLAIGKTFVIEHIGSTAIPGLGGKGIIDILIGSDEASLLEISNKLQQIGYLFRPTFSTEERLYFIIFLQDPIENERRYHLHLTKSCSKTFKDLLFFRDYLRAHPKKRLEYEKIKQEAVKTANQQGTLYRQKKEPFFHNILSLQKTPEQKEI